MGNSLKGKVVAILATDGFEQDELLEPRRALLDAGARTCVIAPAGGHIRAWKGHDWATIVPVDLELDAADVEDFDALLLPGGVMNPDALRMQPKAVAFVRAFFDASKPVAAICHGPWTVLEAGAARNRRLTSWPSLRTDLQNAGAEWVDEQVVVDHNLVTSRKPADIPAFNRAMISLFEVGPGEPG